MSSSTDRIVVGRVGRPHGLRGLVFVHPDTDNPRRFAPGADVEVDGRPLRIRSSSAAERGLLIGFDGVDDRTAAGALSGMEVTIAESERRPLADGEFWPDELVGLEVRTAEGAALGIVAAFVEGVAQGRISVDTGQGLVEVPFVEALVPVVDVAGGYLVVAEVEGLL